MSDPLSSLLFRLEQAAPAPRGADGTVAYAAPWQARLVAMTACALDAGAVEAFATALAAELAHTGPGAAQTPDGYYAAWLHALESHVAADPVLSG